MNKKTLKFLQMLVWIMGFIAVALLIFGATGSLLN